MRKDDIVTLCDFTDDGQMISFVENFKNPELAPPEMRASKNHLKKWWANRSIPLSQGRVESMLKERGLVDPKDYLLKNLGLSLTDYYWIKPVNTNLTWKDVNLFDNEFRENILEDKQKNTDEPLTLSPNSSLRGELEKSWVIKKGKRMLVKGNRGEKSTESINEVFATDLHRMQEYDNYTEYKLLRIKGKHYDYGCVSESFVDQKLELVSAYAIITSEEKPFGKSDYEHLLDVSEKHGIDRDSFKRELEYQIVTDYLLSNVDRHMENIGVLRDSDTLEFIRMAPIFDTGRAFVAGSVTPYTEYEIDNIEVNSFVRSEVGLLELVEDFGIVDIDKLPSQDQLREVYSKDSKMREEEIEGFARLYEKKVERLERIRW